MMPADLMTRFKHAQVKERHSLVIESALNPSDSA